MSPTALTALTGNIRTLLGTLTLTLALAGIVTLHLQAARPADVSPERALLDKYCVSCHNQQRKTAGLTLDTANVDRVSGNAALWEKVVRKMQVGLHPPAGLERPDAASIEGFVSTVSASLDRENASYWTPALTRKLDDAEIAARLATFLWNGAPDDELLEVVKSGKINDQIVLRQQIIRMLADPKSDAFLTNFFGEWLYLRNLAKVKPDAGVFPEFDDTLRDAMREETARFLASQVREDHGVTELLSANYTFLNERLASYYGVPNVKGSEFRRVTLSDEARGGILGQASLLTVTSYAVRTSPILRGKFVIETFFGTPPPAPPPNVPALKDNSPASGPMRARMEQHARNPVCSSCHQSFEPFGFALENFDALGRWRNAEGGAPIDASGVLPDGSTFDGPAQLRQVVLKRRDVLVSTAIERLLGYAIGRRVGYYDMPAVRSIRFDAAPANDRWSAIILGIVQSTPFRTARIEP